MPKLPVVSGKQLIKTLEKAGYFVARRRGSHIRLHHTIRKEVTVPDYKTIGRGLVRKILRETEISAAEFIKLLKNK